MQQVKMTSNETALDFAKSYPTSCVAEPEAHTVTTTPAPEPALMPSLPHAGPLLQMVFPCHIKISPHNFLKRFIQ